MVRHLPERDDGPAEAPIPVASRPRTVLVLGGTGYIGGRLAPRLLRAGHSVRLLVRDPAKLTDVPWRDDVDVRRGDLGDRDSLDAAMAGADVVVHLVHSMTGSKRSEFLERESDHAENVAVSAKRAGVSRIVFLGGLHPDGTLSPHLESRRRVGEILQGSGVPTLVLQAGIVIGSGSASFEMIRHLTEVLPYMPAPRWVRNLIQPIAVRDVLRYLVLAVDLDEDVTGAFDIGGPDVLRYGQAMNGYAVEAGLPQRPIASLPLFTPGLASHWVGLVTPVPRSLAVPLVQSLQYDCVVRDHGIDAIIPPPEGGLLGYRTAVRLALQREREGEVESSWRGASVGGAASDPLPSDPDWAGHTVFLDDRREVSAAPRDALWRVIEAIGGQNGWYSFPLAWAVRGWMDRLVGGVGLRRGRRNAERLTTGDVLDWWRVERIERGSLLLLRAEMRVPGRAWLELRAEDAPGGGSVYRQRAIFFPDGLAGRLYWLAILPFHGVIFRGMASRITAAADQADDTTA